MQAQDIMTRPLVSVERDTPTEMALTLAKMNGIHHFPVCDDGRIVGVVCTCDLREANLKEPVSAVLKGDAITVALDESPLGIALLMQEKCISSVLVRSEEGWGIVTKDDLLEAELEDPRVLDLIEACRCMYCGARKHLRRHNESDFACVTCLDRVHEPEKFESGEVD